MKVKPMFTNPAGDRCRNLEVRKKTLFLDSNY
jgi:hypothetical protein